MRPTSPSTPPTVDLDVLVVGGGPAGLACAAQLARHGRSVCVVEHRMDVSPPPGEHLAPAGVLELSNLDVDPTGLGIPSPGIVSAWGNPERTEVPAPFRAAGAGLHVDRAALSEALRRTASNAGARIASGTRVRSLLNGPGGWHVELADRSATRHMQCRLVVDASGRGASVARRLGVTPVRRDCLVGVAAFATGVPPAMPMVEACELGWWYTATVPDGRLVAIHFTDADLLTGQPLPTLWRQRLDTAPHTASRLRRALPVSRVRGFAAHGQLLPDRDALDWIAVGDAAMALDPLASSGLTTALQGGRQVASALHALLSGDTQPVRALRVQRLADFRAYRCQWRRHYALEQRWPDSPFWQRRQRPTPDGGDLWLSPETLLTRARPAAAFVATLRGVAPDLDAASVAGLADPPLRAAALAARVRSGASYDDDEILGALQALVRDGCLAASTPPPQ